MIINARVHVIENATMEYLIKHDVTARKSHVAELITAMHIITTNVSAVTIIKFIVASITEDATGVAKYSSNIILNILCIHT